jgi:hypothetical protein
VTSSDPVEKAPYEMTDVLTEAAAELASIQAELAKMRSCGPQVEQIRSVSPEAKLYFKAWHGVREWRLVGGHSVKVWGKAGYHRLRVWESDCQICGEPFIITVPRWVTRVDQHNDFHISTCPEHRMTPREVSLIRYARKDERAAVFEEIKRAKLANSKNKD